MLDYFFFRLTLQKYCLCVQAFCTSSVVTQKKAPFFTNDAFK